MSALVDTMPFVTLPSSVSPLLQSAVPAVQAAVPTLERRAITVKNRVQCKQDQVVSWLHDFYSSPGNLEKLLPILQGTSPISLRLIDYFVTNYAKKNFTVYELTEASGYSRRFKVYNDYKLKLRAYSKIRFDPFCRWSRTIIAVDENNSLETTIGQLNFFKWVIENKIIDFIETNYADIEADMISRNSTSRRKEAGLTNAEKTRKKREELSVSACKCIKKETVKIIVKFSEQF
jgi:hypothetical protein